MLVLCLVKGLARRNQNYNYETPSLVYISKKHDANMAPFYDFDLQTRVSAQRCGFLQFWFAKLHFATALCRSSVYSQIWDQFSKEDGKRQLVGVTYG